MKADRAETTQREFTLIPAGFVAGASLGSFIAEPAWGVSLGLMMGATLSMIAEYRKGNSSFVWPIVGGGALLWTLAVLLIERM